MRRRILLAVLNQSKGKKGDNLVQAEGCCYLDWGKVQARKRKRGWLKLREAYPPDHPIPSATWQILPYLLRKPMRS